MSAPSRGKMVVRESVVARGKNIQYIIQYIGVIMPALALRSVSGIH